MNHHIDDHCYTDAISATETYRGCRSDTNHTLSKAAIMCDYNGCNSEASVHHLTCAECDSDFDVGCKMDLFNLNNPGCVISNYRQCSFDSLLSDPQSCFTYQHGNRVIRGCMPNFPQDLLVDDETPLLIECSDKNFCNTDCIPQQSCMQCDSFTNDECRLGNITSHECSSAEDSTCWACEYASMEVKRGCGLSQRQHENDRCYECSDNGCNNAKFSRCYKCSTEIQGNNCATWTNPDFGIEIEECSDPFARCVATMFNNGTVIRGCQTKELQCETAYNSNCLSCEGSFCNKGQFPAQRLLCYQCSNADDSNCAFLDNIEPQPCISNIQTDAEHMVCYEYYSSDQGMVRACSSTSINDYYNCLLQGASCRICNTNGCNNSPAARKPQLDCYTCDHCSLNNSKELALSSSSCKDLVPFGQEEKCFITMHRDGTISSGCVWDDKMLGKSNPWDQTVYCTNNKCNTMP